MNYKNYYTEIDPIGESDIKDTAENNPDLVHDLNCKLYTDIDRLKKEVDNLENIIKDYETYTNNKFLLNALKMQKQRFKSLIDDIYNNFNTFCSHVE